MLALTLLAIPQLSQSKCTHRKPPFSPHPKAYPRSLQHAPSTACFTPHRSSGTSGSHSRAISQNRQWETTPRI